MQINKFGMMLLSVVSCAALLNGCGSSSKEGTTGGVALVEEGTCIVCHSTTTDPVSGTNIVKDYANSIHNPANVPANTTVNANNPDGCQGCHGGGAQHNGVGPIPFPDPLASSRCIVCHTTAIAALFTTELPNEDFAGNCKPCHSDGTSGIHGANLPQRDDCVGCHSVGRAAPPHRSDKIVNDNSGVRAITGVGGEFEAAARNNVMGYRSHHIYNGTGLDPQNAQCLACHLEGKAAAGRTVVTDPAYHMADGKVHLRSGNAAITADIAWDPANPNHSDMDNFCMSCHNSLGAVTAYANMSSALHGMTAIPGALALSPKNPFGDQLTNAYDQKIRPGVVNVYDQMNPSNPSHHAVRGQKYSGRTRYAAAGSTTRGVTSQTPFTQYSGKGNARIHLKAGVLTAYQLFGTYSSSASGVPASGTGPNFPGSRTTIYDAGLFVANYMTLNGQTLGDDSSLHCGDCHSVGQWKPGSANAIVWSGATVTSPNSYTVVATTAAIGAHGSRNEYMLRTSDGSDSLQTQSAATSSSTTASVTGTYVCFLCHTQYYYGDNGAVAQSNVTYGTGAVRGDFGHGGGLGPCNGNAYSGYGKKGTARYGVLVNGIATPAIGNIFGMSCAHCHNSGQQVFGGIHGAVGAYLTYSTNGVDVAGTDFVTVTGQAPGDASGAAYLLNVVNKQSYRFMGGESIRYQGGATASKWESQTPSPLHREGCYNLSQTSDKTHLWNTTEPATSVAGGTKAIVNNNHGDSSWGANADNYSVTNTDQGNRYAQNNPTTGWGSCNHHQGSTTTGPTAPTRVIQRPLVY
jgi:hypothetical protein